MPNLDPPRHRPGRHQDRDHRARRRRRASVLRRRVPTPQDDYGATLRHGRGAGARGRSASSGRRGSVGIGTPGSISRATGLLRGSNSVCLNGQPIKADLEALLGREVRITNDANCFALSEATDGAGAGADVVFGVILGTGVGAGIVVRGRVLDGPERDRRRVGPQSAAVAARRRAARRRRAFAGNAAASRRSCPVRASSAIIARSPASALAAREIARARAARRCRVRGDACAATKSGWRARWRTSSTCSIPT